MTMRRRTRDKPAALMGAFICPYFPSVLTYIYICPGNLIAAFSLCNSYLFGLPLRRKTRARRGEKREAEGSNLQLFHIKNACSRQVVCSLRSSFFSCGQAPVSSWQLAGPPRSGGGGLHAGVVSVWECCSLRLLLCSSLFPF